MEEIIVIYSFITRKFWTAANNIQQKVALAKKKKKKRITILTVQDIHKKGGPGLVHKPKYV